MTAVSETREFLASTPFRAFLVTRGGLFLLAYFGIALLPIITPPGVLGPYRPFPGNAFLDPWCRWDANWYWDIAVNGYQAAPRFDHFKNTTFFPFYPLSMRALSWLTGDAYVAGLLISNMSFLVALCLLYQLTAGYFDRQVASRAVVLWACSPFSFFMAAPFTEALFVALALAAFSLAERDRWFLAAVCGSLSAATRMTGVHVVLALLILYFEKRNFRFRETGWDFGYLVAICPLGMLSFMWFLYDLTGNPLEFVTARDVSGWGLRGATEIPAVLGSLLSVPALIAGRLPLLSVLYLILFGVAVVVSVRHWNRPRLALAVLSISVLVTSLMNNSSAFGRHWTSTFPLFIHLALVLKKDSHFQAALMFSVLLLSLFTVMFGHWHWVG